MNEAVAIPFASADCKTVCTKFGTAYHEHCKGCSKRVQCVTKYLRTQGVQV